MSRAALYAPSPMPVSADSKGVPCAIAGVAVEAIREDWLIGPIGWHTGHPQRRRYYEVVLANGRCLTVFRDLHGRWYRH